MKLASRRGARTCYRARPAACAAVAVYAWLASASAFAQTQADTESKVPQTDATAQAKPADIWNRDTLLGDMGGIRPWLGKYGATLQITETSEYLANLRGGLNRGGAYDGLTTMTLSVDTQKAIGLPGGTFNASALQIHGRNLSSSNLGTLNTASGIEAQATTRLWELWYQQSFLDKRVDVKIGQQSLDQEFMGSTYANTFINTMFGWPALPSYDLPNGGPAYPLAALGVRVRAQLAPSVTALAGVFDGDPLGNNPNNVSGTNFNLHNGALYIGELQYALNPPSEGEANTGHSGGLPGTYKIGVWYHNGRFADQRMGVDGLSLANPASTGLAQSHHGDYSFYAVADQMIWRPDPSGPKSLGVFARVMGAPGDRNLVSFAANAGIVLKAPFQGRDNDSVGLAVTYIQVGNHVTSLDRDQLAFGGGPYGVRTRETTVEATYQYQVTPWWMLAADAQYTFNAGAGQNPNDPARPLRNTFVVGARATITF